MFLKRNCRSGRKTGVAVAVEFMWNGYLFSPLEMKRFLDEIGSKFIGFYFDPGNMAAFQYPQHWARILGSDIKMVHMKDWKGNVLSGGWPGLYYSNVKDQYRRGLYPGLAFIRIHRSCFDIYGSNC